MWLGNNRGNKYSRKHVSLDPDLDNAKFFDFSLQDLAEYDVPAMVDFVIKTTGRPKIAFVGHSQGSAQMFAALAENEKYYNDRLSLFGALAPISRIKNVENGALKLM